MVLPRPGPGAHAQESKLNGHHMPRNVLLLIATSVFVLVTLPFNCTLSH